MKIPNFLKELKYILTGKLDFVIENKEKDEMYHYTGLKDGKGEFVIVSLGNNSKALYKVISRPVHGCTKKQDWFFSFIKFLDKK